MITGTTKLKLEYETTRMGRYAGVRTNVQYTLQEYQDAFERWRVAPGNRNNEWDEYCDVRDCVPIGTNTRYRRRSQMIH